MTGFVYVLGNPSMPGLLKVGMTTRLPHNRMRELSASTSVPEKFELLAYFIVEDARAFESNVHYCLSDYRVSSRREFFKCPPWKVYGGVDGCEAVITNAGVHMLTDVLIDWIQQGGESDWDMLCFCNLLSVCDWNYVASWVEHKTGVSFEKYLLSWQDRLAGAA